MDRAGSPIPRKLAEAFFRRLWLKLLPAVAVPALVLVLVEHDTVYESVGTAWANDVDGLSTSAFTPDSGTNTEASPAEHQVQLLTDLVATRSFRQDVAAGAGLVPAGASADEIAAAADSLIGRMAAVVAGPNLVAIKASAPLADEAQRIAAAFIAHYQLRAQTEATREAATVLAFFDGRVAADEEAVQETRAEIAAYLAAHPAAAATPDAEYQRLLALSALRESALARSVQAQQDARLTAASINASAQGIFVVHDVPALPSAPLGVSLMTRAAYPAAGLVLGLLISAACIWLSYKTDRSVRWAEDVEALDVAVLGSVPELRPADVARRLTPLRWAGFLRRDYARKVAASIPNRNDGRRIAS
jgi:hypothetical protein